MFDSLHNLTLSRPRRDLESLLEHFIFQNFPQTPRKERLLPINIHTIKFRIPHLQILYTPMLSSYARSITVYKFEFDKSMLVGAIIIIKDHKMRQIINDLYLLFLRNITNTNIMYVWSI